MNMDNTEHCIDVCNSLLRGEISAVETYNQAIEKFSSEAESSVLADIRRDHMRSADRLRDHVAEMGGQPTTDSGAWGAWAKTVEGTAKLFGDTSALKALQQGEEHGESEYKEAVEDDEVMPVTKEFIRTELLPRQLKHISILRGLAKAQ